VLARRRQLAQPRHPGGRRAPGATREPVRAATIAVQSLGCTRADEAAAPQGRVDMAAAGHKHVHVMDWKR
jgi:hypothetical protein